MDKKIAKILIENGFLPLSVPTTKVNTGFTVGEFKAASKEFSAMVNEERFIINPVHLNKIAQSGISAQKAAEQFIDTAKKYRDTKMKSVKFTYTNNPDGTITGTDTKSGMTAIIYKDGNSWRAHKYSNTGNLKPQRQLSIGKAMADYYYYNLAGNK